MQSTTSFTFILLICCMHVTLATRLPMEIVEVTSSQIIGGDEKKIGRHKTSTNGGGGAGTVIVDSNGGSGSFALEQRKGRQIAEVHTPRILYQVGSSENDLPICAPNAVCSKIDLYETPWVERQCRCAKSTYMKHSHVIYHPKENRLSSSRTNNLRHMLEQKVKMSDGGGSSLGDFNLESEHIKNLMHKLGAIYNQDDVMADNEYNDYDGSNSNNVQSHPYLKNKKFDGSNNAVLPDVVATKFRHAAHREVQRIGGCPSAVNVDDGHTIADKTRLYKLCEPVHKLPLCRYFRDYTWTLKSSPEMNVTEQIVKCRCPKNSVSYLIRREPLQTGSLGYTYLFACSPQSRLKCQRKEPCKLFTVRKRQEFLDEVNTNPLCQCPRNHRCPRHHTDSGVILGKSYIEDNIRTYSGYCMTDN